MRHQARRTARTALLSAALLVAATPCRALDFAEVELLGYAVSRAGAEAIFGFPAAAPGLVSSDDSETPLGPHDDHDDVAYVRDRLYRDAARVNASRGLGSSGAGGVLEAGHSISVTTGYADAGSNELGARAEGDAGSLGSSLGSGSVAARLEKRITILPGTSGLADGTLVTGLLWVLDGEGSLGIAGRSFPNDSAASAAMSVDVLILRGPTGRCGIFDCPHGALAVKADLSTGIAVSDSDPALPDGRTARVIRHDSWSASNNTGNLKAGAVFESGSETVDLGLPVTQEDVLVVQNESVDTAGQPLALAAIEFEANVGETLNVAMELDVDAVVDGPGFGESDAFHSFAGHVEDPQGRGLVFSSSVAAPEPGAGAAHGAALLLLGLRWIRSRRSQQR